MKVIARIHNDLKSKFGLPRQSGLAPSLLSKIVFEPEFRNADALRGLEGFSHIWIIWDFSESHVEEWSPTVRPPRLGGNRRMGVFATRSPFRPNPIGLSCVRLESIDLDTPDGPVLIVSGADLMNGTPIFDIKPYLPGSDSRPDAKDGFVGVHKQKLLEVVIPEKAIAALGKRLDKPQITALREILSQDPRPAYHDDPDRIYTLEYAGLEVRFRADSTTATVTGLNDITY